MKKLTADQLTALQGSTILSLDKVQKYLNNENIPKQCKTSGFVIQYIANSTEKRFQKQSQTRE